MIIPNSHHGASLAPGWAPMPDSPHANLQTISLPISLTDSLTISVTDSLTHSLTTLSHCVKCSRAHRNRWQANQLRRARIPVAENHVPESLFSGLLSRPAGDAGKLAEAENVVRLGSAAQTVAPRAARLIAYPNVIDSHREVLP